MNYPNRIRKQPSLVNKHFVRIALEEFQTWTAKQREDFEKKAPPLDTEGVICDFNNPYINRVGVPLAMDWIKPADSDSMDQLPVVVIIHGGVLVMGDRTACRRLGVSIARRGYLVAILDYRLIPSTDVLGQFDDICAGLDYVGQKLVEYDVDFSRMFLVAESAGAFLATYVAAMQTSKRLQNAIGHKPSRFRFKAMGLISGMFYTAKNDVLEKFMASQYYGAKLSDESFMCYMDPNHPEIMNQMPPVFLVTSKGDFLNRYTLDFHKNLKQFHKDSHLLYFGNQKLTHSFLSYVPDCPEGKIALDKMLAWFDKKAQEADRRIHLTNDEKLRKEKVVNRMKDKTISKQKMWKMVVETNSVSEARMDNIAIIDGERSYTYRQMFREWGRFAEIFAALGITGKNNSRVAITSAIATEVIFSTYALNKLGASVSIVYVNDTMRPERFRDLIRTEHITDLLLIDYCITPSFLTTLMNDKEELGLKNIIVVHSEVAGPCITKAMRESANWVTKEIRKIPGVLFLRDMLIKYETTPYTASRTVDNESAIIFHTSGTTKGIHKPIPFSDQAMHEAALRIAELPQYAEYAGKARILISVDPANAYGMVNQIHMPLALGCTLVIVPMGANTLSFCRAITYYKTDVVFASATYFEIWSGAVASGEVKVDFSSVKLLVVGGSYLSNENKKRYNDFLAANGATIKLTNGYGLSEAGGACILAGQDTEGDELGIPLPGVNVLIYDQDDKQYHKISDGARSGVMYISSSSLSSGKIDGETFFEPEIIEGVPYMCTYDQVQVNENGSLTFLGRMDRYYINNEGIRFDAGLVETLMAKQDGIFECAVIPLYDKLLHDTQPGLVVALSDANKAPDQILKEAMVKEFIQEGHFAETNLPVICTVVPALPHNATGKIDVHGLTTGEIPGTHFTVTPVYTDEKLTDIQLAPVPSMVWEYASPEGLEVEGTLYKKSGAIIMLLASVSDDLVVFPFFGYWVNYIKDEMPELYKKLSIIDLTSLFQMAKDGKGMNMRKLIAKLQPMIMNKFSNLNGKEKQEMQSLFDLFMNVGNIPNPAFGQNRMAGMQGFGQTPMQGYSMKQGQQGYGNLAQGMPQPQSYGFNPLQAMPLMQGYGQTPAQGYGMNMGQQPQGYGFNQAQGMPLMQGYGQAAPMQGYGMNMGQQPQGYGFNPVQAMPLTQGYGQAPMQGYGMNMGQQPQNYGFNPVQAMPQMQGYGQASMQGYGMNMGQQPQNYGFNPVQAMPQMQGYGQAPMQGYGMNMGQQLQSYGFNQAQGMPQMQGYGINQGQQTQGYGQTPAQGDGVNQAKQAPVQNPAQEAPQQEGEPKKETEEVKEPVGEGEQPAPNMQSYGAGSSMGGNSPISSIFQMFNSMMGSLFRADDTSHEYEED